MSDRKVSVKGATYDQVDKSYLEQRQLKRSAGWMLLWFLGVAAVISGDFFGWQFGVGVAGFGGMLIATVVIAVMYVCMVLCIAEMSTALPHAGGFYSFTRNAFGPTPAFINGVSDVIEYVVTPAVVVFGIGAYADTLVDLPNWIWWAFFYGLFVAINIWGTHLSFQVSAAAAVASMVVLAIFYVGALVSGAFDASLLNNIPPEPGNSTFLPFGFAGVLAALPYAIWFYLAIEQLPLAAEESNNVVKDMPKALIWGIVTLLILSVLTLVLNTGVGGGAAEVGFSLEPLFIGFTAVFGDGATTTLLTVVALIGLIASFHAIIYAYGRILFALSRAGYIPRELSVVSKRHTPHRALLLGAVIGFVITFVLDAVGGSESPAGAALLNMAVFGAVISYAIVMVTYIGLKIRRPDLPRPYVSPLGIPGAVVGALIAIVSLVATFYDEAYRPGVYAVAIFLAVMLAYYFFYSRHRLVAQAPEEEQALIQEAEAELR